MDPQEYVYQESPYNAYKNAKNIDSELGIKRKKFKREFCRKTSKEAHLVPKYSQG